MSHRTSKMSRKYYWCSKTAGFHNNGESVDFSSRILSTWDTLWNRTSFASTQKIGSICRRQTSRNKYLATVLFEKSERLRRFIQGFAKIAGSLSELLDNYNLDSLPEFKGEHLTSFKTLKFSLLSPPVLKLSRLELPYNPWHRLVWTSSRMCASAELRW